VTSKPALEDVPSSDVGATIISTGGGNASGDASGTPAAAAAAGGLAPVGPANAAPLPAIEKPANAPDQVNDVKGQQQPAVAQTLPANGKKPNPKFDANDDSSSKHKKKKGLKKLNPF
jgi:outer membrane protein assembly factor BamD